MGDHDQESYHAYKSTSGDNAGGGCGCFTWTSISAAALIGYLLSGAFEVTGIIVVPVLIAVGVIIHQIMTH